MEYLYPILAVMALCDDFLYFSCILFMYCVVWLSFVLMKEEIT